MNKKIQALHEEGIEVSRQYHRSEKRLISILQEMDDLKGYRSFDCKTLHDYAVREFKLSKDVTYTLIALARKSKLVPELKEKIEQGAIPISQARMIAPILTPQNQSQWLPKAEALSKLQLEKEIKREFPERAVQEKARYVTDTRMELKVGISEELHRKLKRAQDLLSQKKRKAVSLEETLEAITDLFLEKEDPLEKAKRAQTRKARVLIPSLVKPEADSCEHAPPELGEPDFPMKPTRVSYSFAPGRRFPIRNSVKHAVYLRAQGQCEARNRDGSRCAETRWLDLHHLKPLTHGGQDTLKNLKLICKGHHQLTHATETWASMALKSRGAGP